MNKTAIKNFAVWARKKLISDITYRASLLGITDKETKPPKDASTEDTQFFDIGASEPYAIHNGEIEQRAKLASRIAERAKQSGHAAAYKAVVEEVAYTWFNRLIAVRFMEVNGYLPSRVRVLSSESGKAEPDIVTAPFEAGLVDISKERELIAELKGSNKLDELFRFLFLKQCTALRAILPVLFDSTDDDSILLNLSFTDREGIVWHLLNDINEKDFKIRTPSDDEAIARGSMSEDEAPAGQVEIIGWLYQYYNTELKQETFDQLKKNVKITKDRIPAATQIFTPDWIVRYMVENSLGRLWLERHPNDALKANWKYYIDEAEQDPSVAEQLQAIRAANPINSPEDIMFIDPCMGSGHILVYAFDVLMQIYQSVGYVAQDAARLIAEKNLYGLDIDLRAYQLAYFSVLMKARQYDRKLFSREVSLNLCDVKESNEIGGSYQHEMGNFLLERANQDTLNYILDAFLDAKEYGSILKLEQRDYAALERAWQYTASQRAPYFNLTLRYKEVRDFVPMLIRQARYLTQKYDVVCTNPPYMGSSGMNGKLAEFVKREYPDSKSDLFAVFIEQCFAMTRPQRYFAMITQHAWMFLSSFEKLREKLNLTNTVNMAHLGPRAFAEIGGEVVQSTAFVMQSNHVAGYKSTYVRLVDSPNAESKERDYLSGNYRYTASADNFKKIPGSPVAYWAGEKFIFPYLSGVCLKNFTLPRAGLSTGDNSVFLRLWQEVTFSKIGFKYTDALETADGKHKWFPCHSGGEFRKWSTNDEYIVNWEKNGDVLKKYRNSSGKLASAPRNTHCYFKEGLTWNKLSSSLFSVKYKGIGYIFDDTSRSAFAQNINQLYYFLGFLCSKIVFEYLKILNPTMSFTNGDMEKLPLIFSEQHLTQIDILVEKNISISKADWDSFETSWDFRRHPLLGDGSVTSIEESYRAWKACVESRFVQLKANEEELNRIFIDIYGLQDELTPEVADRDVTVARIYDSKEDIPESMKGNGYVLTKADVVKSLVSYGVGCMFGRYSLETDGLAYAGGVWDSGKYGGFAPDKDNVIPITDEEYLRDDIVGRFAEFVRAAFGADTLEKNLDFIARALGNKGGTAREVIRNYFINDFYKDHVKRYQKRPIYWLFDSGRQNGFKALIYLHRYNADTIGNLRIDYLHRMQRLYESEIAVIKNDLERNKGDARAIANAEKRRDKLIKQLREVEEYEKKIAHLAESRISIDLDDGVKVNYEKIQTGRDAKFEVLGKI